MFDFELFEDRERAYEFLVPQRLATVTFTLSGKVKRLTAGAAIDTITAQGPEGMSPTWPLLPDRVAFRETVHGRVGEPLRVPYLPRGISRTGAPTDKPARDEVSLFELRGGSFSRDRFEHLAVEKGDLVLSDLPGGDYELFMKGSGARILVRITAGQRVDDLYVGPFRQLEALRLLPTALERITPEGADLVVHLRATNPFTRVHVIATRMTPDFDLFAHLAKVRGAEPWAYAQGADTTAYVSGRNLGDEISYILRRRGQTAFANAMVDRPSLLLHPWAIDDTQTAKQDAQAGDDFKRAEPPPASMAAAADMATAADAARRSKALHPTTESDDRRAGKGRRQRF